MLNSAVNSKTHSEDQTGPNEAKLKEFQFKLIHRIVVTKKELFRFGIKPDHDECLYCGDKDSIEHTFIECPFTKIFVQKVVQWFNETNSFQISPTVEEVLFGIISNSHETKIKRKFNYTTLSMRKYIYSNKINSETISIHEFINKLPFNYNLENIN